MKAIKYTRIEYSFHIHNTVHIDIIYIDDLDICLYKQRLGSFSSVDYGIITNQTLTIEAKEIFHDNEIPSHSMSNVEFKNIVRFDIEDVKDNIILIINKIKEHERTKMIAEDFIEDLLNSK